MEYFSISYSQLNKEKMMNRTSYQESHQQKDHYNLEENYQKKSYRKQAFFLKNQKQKA